MYTSINMYFNTSTKPKMRPLRGECRRRVCSLIGRDSMGVSIYIYISIYVCM